MDTYGYIRVSSKDQNEDRQVIEMDKLGIPKDKQFIDHQSGKDFNRPKYLELLEALKPGDLLYILSIDRLGRNYKEIQTQWGILSKDKKIDIVVIDMPVLDTRKREGDLMGAVIADVVLQLLAFVAEKEYQSIHERQAAGIAAARIKGVRFGRPVKKPPENFPAVVRQWERGDLLFVDALARTGLTEGTFYRRLRELRVAKMK